jgi:cell wall assembly regulator SMI1
MSETKSYKYAKIVESLRDDPRNGYEAGSQIIVFGKDTDPDYNVLTEDGPRLITHELVKMIEAPQRLTEDEFTEYIQEEVLPLE